MIIQTNKIDLIPSGDPLVVHVSQYDTTARTLAFDLYNGGVAFEMPEGASASINGTKPDGTAFMYEMDTEGNTASIQLEQQMALVAGDVICEIQITASGGGKLGTANFILRVERAAIDENTVISETDLPIFEELASSAQESAATASAAATTATTAASQVASIVPDNTGTAGQVLTRTGTGARWESPQTSGHEILDANGDLVVPARDKLIFDGPMIDDNNEIQATRIQTTLVANITQNGGVYETDVPYIGFIQAIEAGIFPMVKYGNAVHHLTMVNTSAADPYVRFTQESATYNFDIYIYQSGTVQRTKVPGYQYSSITLLASGWNNGVYTAPVSIAAVSSSSTRQSVTMPSTRTQAQYQACAAAKMDVAFSAGQITFTANGTVPTIDLPILYEKWTV